MFPTWPEQAAGEEGEGMGVQGVGSGSGRGNSLVPAGAGRSRELVVRQPGSSATASALAQQLQRLKVLQLQGAALVSS